MADKPSAQRRARTTPVAESGFTTPRVPQLPASLAATLPPRLRPPVPTAPALPPLPGNYVWALLVLLAGVVGLHLLGATLNEALFVVEVLAGTIGLHMWRQGK